MQLSLISLALTKVYGGVAAFSPSSLFASGEQGAWYDPSDLSTMFQDSAGTTPVTADGQPVGLILDKSKELVLGSELITNAADRELSSDTGFWAKASVTISGGVVNYISAPNTAAIYKNPLLTIGKYYEITFTIVSISEGAIGIGSMASIGAIRTKTEPGTYTERICASYSVQFSLMCQGTTTATCDNISIKEISGNHASQATAAARPLYKTDGTYHWLQFDGIDDSLSTANIDFTSTTKMSVFAGLRKASDAAAGQYFETSTDAAAANPGAFRLSAPTAAAENYGGLFRGATGSSSGSYSGFPALVKNVVTTLINGAASGFTNVFTTRINQTVATPSVGANGDSAANFGNYPAFFGSRNGTERFNGNIYSLIVRGSLSTADETTATETWVAAKTGVTL